MKAWFVVVWLE